MGVGQNQIGFDFGPSLLSAYGCVGGAVGVVQNQIRFDFGPSANCTQTHVVTKM